MSLWLLPRGRCRLDNEAMVKKADIPEHLIETALRLAAERGWKDLSLAEIAEAAGLPMSKVYPVYRSKRQILEGLSRMVDAEVLAGHDAEDMEGSARDRLFDVMMRRFDALQPYKSSHSSSPNFSVRSSTVLRSCPSFAARS